MRYLPVLLLCGCFAAMGYSSLEQVTTAAREYNNDVRWGNYDQAARHVPTSERQRFIDRHSSLENDLEIADFEMTDIQVDKSKHSADARVQYTWSLKTRGIVEKTTTKQKWERRNSEWVMLSEERVKGAPLVLFEEPHPTKEPVEARADAQPAGKTDK
jgi:hypothetical protein